MAEDPNLLPMPRQWNQTSGIFSLEYGKLILLDHTQPQDLRFTAGRFQHALQSLTNLHWETIASSSTPSSQIGLTLRIAPDTVTRPQGYILNITPKSILIEAHDEPGLFYGVCSLNQLIQSVPGYPYHLPCIQITDFPDFPVRGVMLDVSRDKVPTLETTLALIDRLAGWKINQFQLYFEHTFAYRQHPEVWANASPFTGEEILQIDAYCRERYIDFVPNQNSFGHMHRWLVLPRYQHLAEAPYGFVFPWGRASTDPFSLCPADPGSLELIRSLYAELLPHFSSRLFNVGCDETFDLGQGRSKEACEQRGKGQVYLDFLLQIHREVKHHGRTMLFWGDIINQHPELVSNVPKDSIALEWGYEADHPFDEHCARYARAGLEFYVCPGTSSWNSIAGRTSNAIENLLNAADNGLKHGAVGYLITDWGDNGHWQTLPVSYLGFLAGAAYSWCLGANRHIPLPQALNTFAFEDISGSLGSVAYDLGNIYHTVGVEPGNSSALFWMLHDPLEKLSDARQPVSTDVLYGTLSAVDQAIRRLDDVESHRPDADLIISEFNLAARMLQHAVYRGFLSAGVRGISVEKMCRELTKIIDDYRAVWLSRNRPGGLKDSLSRLERARTDYY